MDDETEHSDSPTNANIEENGQETTKDPTEFDVKAFNDDLEKLREKLQSDKFKNPDMNFPADDLTDMVGSIRGVMEDYKQYSDHTAKQLDVVRAIMYEIKDKVYKKIHSRPYEPKSDGRVSLEEKELEAKIQNLNKELAKVGDELLNSSQLVIETESKAAEATLIAEQAVQEAKRTQQEYEKRRSEEQEKRRIEEEERQEKERKKEEERQKKEEERKMEESRRARLKKNPSVVDGMEAKAPDWESWPTFDYTIEGPGGKELGCVVRADPMKFSENSLKCELVQQSESDFKYDPNDELVGNIIRIKYSNEAELEQSPIQVAIPHCISRASASSREATLKVKDENGAWIELPSTEVTFEGHKDLKMAQAELSRPTDLAVVSRFKRDFFVMPKRGGRLTSGVDSRLSFSAEKNTFKKPENFVAMLQPVDSATVSAIKSTPEGQGLLTSSAITSMEWTSTEFDGDVTITVPVPPNPVKAKKAAAAKAAKEAKMKQPLGMAPVSSDETPQQRRKKPAKKQSQQKADEDGDDEDDRPAKKVNTTKWYMGQYGNLDEDEHDLLFFIQKMQNGKWLVRESMAIEQVKLDIVQINISSPVAKFVILRTRTSVEPKDAQKIVDVIEKRLKQRTVQTILNQRSDDLCEVLLQVVPVTKIEKVIKSTEEEGYEEGPGTSKEVLLQEGDTLEVTYRGNISAYDKRPRKMIFNSQLSNRSAFSVVEVDKYLQKSYQVYRGFVQVEKVETVVRKGKRNDDGTEEEAVTEVVRHLITDHLVSIPKDSEQPVPVNRVQPVLIQPDNPINEQFLRHLAASLGDEWQKLAHYLNVKKVRLQAIIRDNRLQGDEETKYDMLMSWVKKVPRGANKVDILRSALSKSSREDLAKEVADLEKEYKDANKDGKQ